jgi:phospholipid/cholesterol/gamma-HCH transport system permease protein
LRTFAELLSLLGAVMAKLAGLLVRPWRLRLTSLVHHMEATGLNAAPIVSLMAFLIGVVLAFQGATQLRPFGAEVFVVDLIAISVLRELGILLTAIIVAGRSASAFTAAIGSMKMREEVDAMRTLGLDPVEVLVLPRILALIITLPILGLIADLMGLLGGATMAWINLNVSPGMFQARLLEGTDAWDYAVGLIKAPFFALIIGLIGCYEGLKVEGTAESLGRLTSRSVVLAIFMVIVVDALFSIFFAVVNI